MSVKLYGDRHNSERRAHRIQSNLAKQNPDVLMLESLDLRGEELSYTLESFVKYPSLGHVYKAFGLDIGNLDKSKRKTYESPMYKNDLARLKDALESLFERYEISVSVQSIIDPENIALDTERDKAITSLFRTLSFMQDSNKNTLLPRLGLIKRKNGASFRAIDLSKDQIYRAAAENIDQAPSDPQVVAALLKKARKGQTSGEESKIAKAILDGMSPIREQKMSQQIQSIMSNGYSNGAAIMGRAHLESVSQNLQNRGMRPSMAIE